MHLQSVLLLSNLLAARLLPLAAQPNVLTYHNDVRRTGQNLAETILTTSNVNSAAFGKIFQSTLDGAVDAQPLYVAGVSIPSQGTHNVLIVATENDSLYALDADTGAQLWKVTLLASGETAVEIWGSGRARRGAAALPRRCGDPCGMEEISPRGTHRRG